MKQGAHGGSRRPENRVTSVEARPDGDGSGSGVVDLDRFGWALAAYSIVAYLVCFWRLGATKLIHMEGMVADGARHMIESGDWLVPRVYGEINTFKPALAYWLGSLSFRLDEQPSEWLLRLPFAASVFAMGLIVLLLLRKLAGNRTAALCAIASVSGVIVVEKVKLAEFDGILTAGVGIAVVAACYNLAARKASPGVWILGYVGLTVGFLAKGVPALMVYPPGVLAAGWLTGRFRRLLDWRHLIAAMLFLTLSGGYLLGMYRSAGPAAFEEPIAESKLRGFTWVGSRLAPEERAAKLQKGEFFLEGNEGGTMSRPLLTIGRTLVKPVLVVAAFLPWGLLLPLGLSERRRGGGSPEAGLVLRSASAFLVTGIVLFMAVPTHAMRYYMPLAAAAGIVAGILAGDRSVPRSSRVQLACVGFTGLIAGLCVLGALLLPAPPATLAQRAVIGLVGISGLASVVLLHRRRSGPSVVSLLLTATVCMTVLGTLGFQVQKAAKRDQHQQALALDAKLPDEGPVWVLGPSNRAGKNSSLLFYLRRPVLAFRLAGPLPPNGSYCIVPSDRLDEIEGVSTFEFEPIVRAEYHWRDFLLGRCSTRAHGPDAPH